MINLEIIDNQNPYNELARDYWLLGNSEEFVFSIKQLQVKYNLKQSQLTNMIKNLAFAYSSEIVCSDCGIPYPYTSRSDFSFKKIYQQFDWTCKTCIKERAQLIIDEKNYFLSMQKTKTKRNINDLSITELIYLITLIKHSSYKDGIIIDKIIVENSYLLTPHKELDMELLRDIDKNNICIISDKNPLSNLQENTDGSYSYYLYETIREVWVNDYNGFNDLHKLESYLVEKSNLNPTEFYQIIEKISVYECIAYLQLNLEKRSIVIDTSERAHSLIKKLLDALPVNIIWGIIFSSIKSTSDYILQNKGTYKSRNESYIAGVLYNKIENYFERALANNWELKAYNRDFNLPQSSISRLCFSTILKTDDGGFTQIINSLFAHNSILLEEEQHKIIE